MLLAILIGDPAGTGEQALLTGCHRRGDHRRCRKSGGKAQGSPSNPGWKPLYLQQVIVLHQAKGWWQRTVHGFWFGPKLKAVGVVVAHKDRIPLNHGASSHPSVECLAGARRP